MRELVARLEIAATQTTTTTCERLLYPEILQSYPFAKCLKTIGEEANINKMTHIEIVVNDIDLLNTFFQPHTEAGKGDDEIKGYVLKMEKDGPVCASIVYQKLKINANWVFIHALHTKEEHTEKGYERALLENLMKVEFATQICFVEASKVNPDLKPMFRNLGFIPSPTHDEQVKVDIPSLGEEGKETLVLDNKA
jgi:hypothetical protein